MFGRKTNNSGLPNDLYEFLEEADRLYIKAFETRTIGILKEYFTRDCCFAISRWIIAEASSRYFCDEKYRKTTWSIIQSTPTEIILEKDCVYKDIHLTISRSMKVSDDYKESWRIQLVPSGYMVAGVQMAT